MKTGVGVKDIAFIHYKQHSLLQLVEYSTLIKNHVQFIYYLGNVIKV